MLVRNDLVGPTPDSQPRNSSRASDSADGPSHDRLREKDWSLTQEAFDGLLAALDPDREVAGQKYESIRGKVMKFFECRGCCTPSDQADQVINLVAKKISEGQQVLSADPSRYFYGVARNVLRDYWRVTRRRFEPVHTLAPAKHPIAESPEVRDLLVPIHQSERWHWALEQCLGELPDESRDLIIGYYTRRLAGGARKIDREALASNLGIPINALRIRAHRIRIRLRGRLDDFMKTGAADQIWQ
jgi:DNA-directed RNA polymerase specialized sigma24 family protein